MYEKCLPNKKFVPILVKFGKPKHSLSPFEWKIEAKRKKLLSNSNKFYRRNFVDFNAINKNVFSSAAFDWCYKIKSLIINNFTIWNAVVFFQFADIFVVSMLQRLYFKETLCHRRGRRVRKSIFEFPLNSPPALSTLLSLLAWTTSVGSLLWWINLVPDTQPFDSREKVKVSDYTRVWITYGTTKIWITYLIVRNNRYF